MKSIFHILSHHMPLVIVTATMASAWSCTDDVLPDSSAGTSPYINFAVAQVSGVYARSGNDSYASMPQAVLSADDDTLYMTGTVTAGFPSDSHRGMSRATAVTSSTMSSFGVYAAQSSGALYMNNIEVTREGDVWVPEREYLWPGDGNLSFNAYAPFASSESAEGITSLPTGDSYELGFKVPANVAEQIDLLRATPTIASASPCSLNFSHALTAVRFATGAKMRPCSVKSVSVEGVTSSATLDLVNGQWSNLADTTTFTAQGIGQLDAAEGSQYVAADTPLAADSLVMMLLPQDLGEDAKVVLTVESSGKESTFTASIAGQTWSAGTTVTYRLSADPATSSMILEIVDSDGNPVKELNTPYTGGKHHFTVLSHFTDNATATTTPVEWTASFLDTDGKPIDSAPDWIISFPTSGNGDEECTMTADMPTPQFEQINEHSANLRKTADINSTSGHERYNLASSTGDAAIENTANSYIINAPGKYSLPLVYGNAIKNGTTNEAAYRSTVRPSTAHNRQTLYNFVNHLGNAISDPYIYNNAGCIPADAVLEWEGRLNLVRHVELSADGKSIEFEVPASSIRQGNAVVAVRDASGTIMWSWHLWVTDIKEDDSWIDFTNEEGSANYSLMSCNLGRIYGGDVTKFLPSAVKVRFTQKNAPEGQTPLTVDIPVNQESATISTPDCHPYYQWGRKDPMISSIKEYYNADHTELDGLRMSTDIFPATYAEAVKSSIVHPLIFFVTQKDEATKMNPFYFNLWNIDLATANASAANPQNIKTVYDPCPVGAKVPNGNEFLAMTELSSEYDSATKSRIVHLPGGKTISFSTLGYRTHDGGEAVEGDTGTIGAYWCDAVARAGKARYMVFQHTGSITTDTEVQTIGFGLRPARDK